MSADPTWLDGTSVAIEIARPEDAEAVLAFTRGLSPDSRHRRFFAGLGDDAIAHEVRRELQDNRNLSILARSKLDHRILGHGFAALISADRAELAFAVADDVQHHGIGTMLLAALLHALRACGVRHFEATTLPENRAMREVFSASGFTMLLADANGIRARLDDPLECEPAVLI